MNHAMRKLLVTLGVLALAFSCLLTGCSGQTYRITVDDGEKLIDQCPSSAEKGERVTIHTMSVTDADLIVTVSGAEDGRFVREGIYEFTMPAQDVKVRAYTDTSGYPGA